MPAHDLRLPILALLAAIMTLTTNYWQNNAKPTSQDVSKIPSEAATLIATR